MMTKTAEQIWETTLGELQLQVSRANYETWLKDTVGLSYQGNRFLIGTSSPFATEWLQQRLHSLVKRTLMGVLGRDVEVSFQLHPKHNGAGVREAETPAVPAAVHNGNGARSMPLKLNPRYTFASFIVGSCNRLAHAAALAVGENPGQAYNPLFIYGGVGLGKTHLLHAIGNKAAESMGDRFLFVTCEQFTNEFINALREKRNEEFRGKYRSVNMLLMDDIQFIAGKEQTQEVLFHTFNDLHNAGQQIVISSDRHPRSMPLLEDRLRSRFEWGLIADIQPPDLETRLAILKTKAEEQGATVPDEVFQLIARKAQKNIRELEGCLHRVIAYSRLTRANPSLELAQQALADLMTPASKRNLTPPLIVAAVADYFKLDLSLLLGKRRDKNIVLARHVAMYLIREETQRPWAEIGRELGNRDHTTIIHGYEKIAREINIQQQLRRDVLEIKDRLYSG